MLDCGTAFTHSGDDVEFKADFTLKMMERLGYNAMNAGIFDLRFLEPYLKNGTSFPVLSTNLRGPFPFLKRFEVLDVSGIRIGVLGVLPPEDIKELVDPKGLRIDDPAAALREVLPDLRGKVDFVILLSQLTWKDTMDLIEEVDGIDTAISCSQEGVHSRPAGDDEPLCHLSKGGDEVGVLVLKETEGDVRIVSREMFPTDDRVLGDETVKSRVEQTLYQRRKHLERQREMEARKKLLEGLKMSPQDFIETMNKGDAAK